MFNSNKYIGQDEYNNKFYINKNGKRYMVQNSKTTPINKSWKMWLHYAHETPENCDDSYYSNIKEDSIVNSLSSKSSNFQRYTDKQYNSWTPGKIKK